MSSLKSPRIRQGKLDIETWFNTLDSRLVNVCNGMLGDLYNSAIWICILFANNVVLTASMPLDAYLCVLAGCICLGMLIIMPPLLSPDALSHLIAIWSSCTTGEGCDGVSQVSQKHSTLAYLRPLSLTMSGSLASIDHTFNNEI